MKGLSIRDVKAVGARRFDHAMNRSVAWNVWVVLAFVVLLAGLGLMVFSGSQSASEPEVYETSAGDVIEVQRGRVVWNDMVLEAEVSERTVSARIGIVVSAVLLISGMAGVLGWMMTWFYKRENYEGDFVQKWVDSGVIPLPED